MTSFERNRGRRVVLYDSRGRVFRLGEANRGRFATPWPMPYGSAGSGGGPSEEKSELSPVIRE